jgi:hypothetical protein
VREKERGRKREMKREKEKLFGSSGGFHCDIFTCIYNVP